MYSLHLSPFFTPNGQSCSLRALQTETLPRFSTLKMTEPKLAGFLWIFFLHQFLRSFSVDFPSAAAFRFLPLTEVADRIILLNFLP